MKNIIIAAMFLLSCKSETPVAPDTETTPSSDSALQSDSGYNVAEHANYESAEKCAECHPVHYDEWRQSMHAYAAKSPVFDAMAAKAYRDTSGEIGTFCTGCHSPFGEAEGENGALDASERSDLSLEGVSCDYCHTAVEHDGQIGNNQLINLPGELKLDHSMTRPMTNIPVFRAISSPRPNSVVHVTTSTNSQDCKSNKPIRNTQPAHPRCLASGVKTAICPRFRAKTPNGPRDPSQSSTESPTQTVRCRATDSSVPTTA